MLGGTGTVDRSVVGAHRPSRSASDPSSISIEISSSTNSGFPSAASAIRRSTSGSRDARPSNCSIRLAASASVSGSRWIVVALSFPPPHIGRRSSSSARARHSRSIGASRDQSAMCSIEIQERRLGPMDVVEDDDAAVCVERRSRRAAGSTTAFRRARRPLRTARSPGRRRRRPGCLLVTLEQRSELRDHVHRCVVVRDTGGRPDRLRDRQERHALPVRARSGRGRRSPDPRRR